MKKIYYACTIIFLSLTISCKKESETPRSIPAYLTEKIWTLDTILINLPNSYDNLTDEQKFYYNSALGWSKDKAQINLRNDGSVNCSGDWDFGYIQWQLINNDKDIKMTNSVGNDTLRLWSANELQFTYINALGLAGENGFDCIFICK